MMPGMGYFLAFPMLIWFIMKRVILIVVLISILAGAGWAVESWTVWRTSQKTAQFNEDVDNLFYALQQYKERVGSYPVGGNADVAKALLGQNPKNLIILVGRKQDLNTKGEFVDPWGTPLRIYFSGEGILVRSAGPNKRFDDSTVLNPDDYYRSN
jgi:type II secretory pathway pseudopilin PulG